MRKATKAQRKYAKKLLERARKARFYRAGVCKITAPFSAFTIYESVDRFVELFYEGYSLAALKKWAPRFANPDFMDEIGLSKRPFPPKRDYEMLTQDPAYRPPLKENMQEWGRHQARGRGIVEIVAEFQRMLAPPRRAATPEELARYAGEGAPIPEARKHARDRRYTGPQLVADRRDNTLSMRFPTHRSTIAGLPHRNELCLAEPMHVATEPRTQSEWEKTPECKRARAHCAALRATFARLGIPWTV